MEIRNSEYFSREKIAWDAIVLGLDINGLGVVRSLSTMDLNVLGIYSSNDEIGRFSRFCTSYRINNEVDGDGQNLVRFLLSLEMPSSEKPVIFPTSDLFVKIINENRELLDDKYLFMLPERNLLDMIISKQGQHELALIHNLAVPVTHRFNNLDEIKKNINIKFPCILKPLDSFSGSMPDDEKNLIFNTFDEMHDYLSRYPDIISNSIIQEIISGGDTSVYYCTMYLNRESNPLGIFSARKIRQYKPDFGITCFAESRIVQEVIDISLCFLKKIKYNGLVDIEFIRDEREGIFKFIELNPRTHWANSHSTSCGVNLPCIAYSDAKRMDCRKYQSTQKEGIKWIYFKSDMGAFVRKRKKDQITFIQWMSSVLTARSFACFNRRDPLPFFIDSYILLREVIAR